MKRGFGVSILVLATIPAQAQLLAPPQTPRTATGFVPLAPKINGPLSITSIETTQLDALAIDADYPTLSKLATQALSVSAREFPRRRAYCIKLASCLTRCNYGLDTASARQLARQCACAALVTSDEHSWQDDMELVKLLVNTPEPDPQTQSELWRTQRWVLANNTLHILERIEFLVKTKPPKMPRLTTTLPLGVYGFEGMSPQNIPDPLLRAQYQQNLILDSQQRHLGVELYEAHEKSPEWTRYAQAVLPQIFDDNSIEPTQARELVETANIDPDLKAQLLAHIAAKTAAEKPAG